MTALSRRAPVVAALLAWAVFPATASGHAKLLGSKPGDGQTLERAPRAVVLTFNEGIETAFVQLRVEDTAGRGVDRGEPYHPGGREELVAVRLRPGLRGTFVARYRVISEDGHPVGKRTKFRVRPPEPERESESESKDEQVQPMAPPGQAMPETGGGHEESLTGEVTDTAFAAARGVGYVAIALGIGGTVFLFVVWLPALARATGAGAGWRTVSGRFVHHLRSVVLGAVLVGVGSTLLAIVLETATAAGVSFWMALDPGLLELVSDLRVAQAWMARVVVWLIFGAMLVLALRPHRAPVVRRVALGAEGAMVGPAPSRVQMLGLATAVLALAFTAPMAGHTGTYSPRALLMCTDTLHVLSMSVWLGGLAMLLIVVPMAVRALAAGERTPLLAGVVGRFSRMATIAVALLLLTGVVQSIALVGSVPALVETAYGRLVLAKIALFIALVSLGAYNQRRSLPRLRRLAAGGEEPGRAAVLLRRAVAAEAAFALVVLGVTSVLVATEPAVAS